MAFQCTVVTPEQQAFDQAVQQVVLPAHDGLIGILAGHAPLLVKLGLGPLRIDLPDGQRRFYYVEGGVAEMKEDRLTILTGQAVPAEEIDAETARAEYAEAVARQPTDAKSQEARQRQLQRATAKQELAARR